MSQNNEVTSQPVKKLERIPDGKMIAGVCTGFADYFGIDVTIVRLAVALISFITGGAGVIAYIVGMLIIPERGAKGSDPQPPPPSAPPSSAPPPPAPPPSEQPPSV